MQVVKDRISTAWQLCSPLWRWPLKLVKCAILVFDSSICSQHLVAEEAEGWFLSKLCVHPIHLLPSFTVTTTSISTGTKFWESRHGFACFFCRIQEHSRFQVPQHLAVREQPPFFFFFCCSIVIEILYAETTAMSTSRDMEFNMSCVPGVRVVYSSLVLFFHRQPHFL